MAPPPQPPKAPTFAWASTPQYSTKSNNDNGVEASQRSNGGGGNTIIQNITIQNINMNNNNIQQSPAQPVQQIPPPATPPKRDVYQTQPAMAAIQSKPERSNPHQPRNNFMQTYDAANRSADFPKDSRNAPD